MVTPYEIDMRFANIINKGDGKDSGKDLYAANADGNYIGFMGATSWEGFYLQEADGTVWHTAKSGSTATPFFLTTDAAEGTWICGSPVNRAVTIRMSIPPKNYGLPYGCQHSM